MNRRDFLTSTSVAAAGLALAPQLMAQPQGEELEVHIFSKHLQFLSLEDMAKAARDLGFDGVDLAVRPGGHVEPELVASVLPKAAEALRREGIPPRMMVTALTDSTDPTAKNVLQTAHDQGISQFRTGWIPYPADQPVPESLRLAGEQLHGLAALSREIGLTAMYQNHAGNYVGAAIWDLHHVLSTLPEGGMGCQFDLRHATVEGASVWFTHLRLMGPFIRSLALKDAIWVQERGRVQVKNVPVGEGMVDFRRMFGWMKENGIRVPASLHLEYELGGAEEGKRSLSKPASKVLAAMSRDLEKVRQLWREA